MKLSLAKLPSHPANMSHLGCLFPVAARHVGSPCTDRAEAEHWFFWLIAHDTMGLPAASPSLSLCGGSLSAFNSAPETASTCLFSLSPSCLCSHLLLQPQVIKDGERCVCTQECTHVSSDGTGQSWAQGNTTNICIHLYARIDRKVS